ncbi:hypothetical protein OUZ56_000331 [Daphnia magna]|uniref:Uncharacterized protein n=1 Tax=Daphnia magna TaxID=35525 RepID=A0ABR0A029_9CRUS|nr:hypothetical protein OUZ56_000331 [Daphnia magna]
MGSFVEKIEDEDFLHCLRGENLSCWERAPPVRGLACRWRIKKTPAHSILFLLSARIAFSTDDLTLQWLDLQPSSTVEPTDPTR